MLTFVARFGRQAPRYCKVKNMSIVRSIFANGEQGFAYDPNDLTTLFQDARDYSSYFDGTTSRVV